jgi:hypothetical protein
MRKYWKVLLVTLCLAWASASIVGQQKSYCFPENDLYIGVNDKSVSGMDEETFNHVIDVVEDLYLPIVKELGGELKIERKWEDGTVNAYAQRVGNVYKVSMFGGLARHETVTPEGFALVVCHEIGHHIGGAPKKKVWWGTAWASNEGQADYWGSTKCMKRTLEVLEEQSELEESEDYKFALKECEKSYDQEHEQLLCARSSMAGKSLANLFRALRRMEKELHFHTPDKNVVEKTNDAHPKPQCRMDTYFAGALCEKSVEETVSDSDEAKGLCYFEGDHKIKERPLCWFRPKK